MTAITLSGTVGLVGWSPFGLALARTPRVRAPELAVRGELAVLLLALPRIDLLALFAFAHWHLACCDNMNNKTKCKCIQKSYQITEDNRR